MNHSNFWPVLNHKTTRVDIQTNLHRNKLFFMAPFIYFLDTHQISIPLVDISQKSPTDTPHSGFYLAARQRR